MKNRQRAFIGFLCFLILTIGLGMNYWLLTYLERQTIYAEHSILQYSESSSDVTDLQHIIHESQKNVVQINVETENSSRVGSGFLYNTRGDIVTNQHVIKDAKSINITMSNAETYPAAIVGFDVEKDIAVIRVPQLINQQPIHLNTTEKLLPGAEIIAVGSPLGLQHSVTVGIISGVDRSFSINEASYENVYQISATITHGNSGGPLIDRKTGKVVAINSAGYEDSDIGFSIPITDIIDDITEWSTSTDNGSLTFPSSIIRQDKNINALTEDAMYLVQYFIESIAMHDYINAYTLLGSALQSDIDYPSFRSRYLQLVDLTIFGDIEAHTDRDTISLQLKLNYSLAQANDESTLIQYRFIVGYENDQLKILEYELE
ncbi:Trypsin-like peptidase domain-containing protein [Amphibacillus marinus]|uniref:Trypsin-like peptidase domain-containing protein n=1 Tax=Amphibacillus marinus TaxID=872970 RepID=A0A1H8IC20_9BACI|nr:trypsin-like peptidase domain-containing protein [Amphibacillus marinus]SEN65722.1 Trypsin-like peptidase domain-containing protein [Amphibacillus marinus]